MPGQPRPSTVLPWAAEANYPGGFQPWSGQPCKAVAPNDYFTPQIPGAPPVPAEYLNQKFSDYAIALQQMQDWSGNKPAQCWSPAFASTVFTGQAVGQIQAVRWEGNPSVRQWLASVTYGTAAPANLAALYTSADQGQSWQLAGGSTIGSDSSGFLSQAACVDPNSAASYLAAISFAGGSPLFQVNKAPFGGAWSNVYQSTSIQPVNLNVCTSGSTAIFAYVVTGVSGTLLSTSNSGSSWQTKTLAAAPEWVVRSSGNVVQQVLAVPLRVAKNTVGAYFTWDGVTLAGGGGPSWQVQALPTQMGNFDQVLALTWATTPLGQCWVMCVMGWNAAGTQPLGTQFYVSGDGALWFLVPATGLGVQFFPPAPAGYHTMAQGIMDIAAVGGLLIAAGDPGPGTQTGLSRIYVSVDGAATWRDSQVTLQSNAANTGVGWSRTRLAASDFGFLAGNTNWGRFSHAAGLPSVTY